MGNCHRLVQLDEDECSPCLASGVSRKQSQVKCQLHAGHNGCCRVCPRSFDPGEDCLCAICLEALPRPAGSPKSRGSPRACGEELPMLVFPCRHGFHVRCAEPWLQRSDLCPLCRSPTHPSMFRRSLEWDRSSEPSSPSTPGSPTSPGSPGSPTRRGSASHLRQLRSLANSHSHTSIVLNNNDGLQNFTPSAGSLGNLLARTAASRGL